MLTARSIRSAPARPAVSRPARAPPVPARSVSTRPVRAVPVVRRAAYATQAQAHKATARQPVTDAELEAAYESLDADACADGVYASTLVPSPQWDRILGMASSLPTEVQQKYIDVINDIKNSRGDTGELENAFKSGQPLPESYPLAEEINPFIGKFTEDEISDAFEHAIFGTELPPNPKFAAIAQEVNEILTQHEEEPIEELEEIFQEEAEEDDSGAWAHAFAESLSASEGLDEHVVLSAFETAEAVSSHAYSPELFENPAVAEGEAIAARDAYWEHKQDGAGTPYVDHAFTDSEVAFLIHIAKTNSDFDTAAGVFKRNLKSAAPSTIINDQFLEFAFNREKVDEVFKGIDDMKAAGHLVSADAYATGIRAAASKGDVAKATGYLNDAKASGQKVTSRMYAALIFANGKAKQLDKARQVLKDMEADGVHPDGLVYHALILAEFKAGKADAWERIKKEMAEKNITPHPLSNVFLDTEQLEASVPKIAKKARTPAQRKNKKSSTNATVLSSADAAKLMDVIEEKAFQRKQGIFVNAAGNFYTPLAPVYNTVGGATTQRVHVNRLILSAHRFPHHHRVSPIAKLLIEGYFLEGTKAAQKLKKGQKLIKVTPKGFTEFDVEGLQTALKSLTEKLNKSAAAGEAVMQIPDILTSFAEARSVLTDSKLKAEAIKAIEEMAATDSANAAHYQTLVDWAKKHDGSIPKKMNPAAFSMLFEGVIKAHTNEAAAEEGDAQAPASAAGADMYTQVLKRVAQSDKKKATFFAHALDGHFKGEKRAYEVDPATLTVNARK